MRAPKLNVIFLSDEYLPNSTRIHAKMIHELAKIFSQNGHQSVILTPGNSKQEHRLELFTMDEVKIWRFRASNFRGKGKVLRALNETLLPLRALYALVTSKEYKKVNFDLCINYSPTIFFAPVAKYFQIKNTFIYLVLRDFFPQWAIDNGILKNKSIVTSFFRFIEKLNYRSSNIIAVQSHANVSVFRKIYPYKSEVRVLMNWSEEKKLTFLNHKDRCSLRQQLGLNKDKVIFFFGGNIGHAQDMMNIMRLVLNFEKDKRAYFLLVGQGDEFEIVGETIKNNSMTNLKLLPSVSQEKYREYIASADIGLFSLSKTHTSHNFPGKLLGYMAGSLPILGSVNKGNDVADIINVAKAGTVSLNGNDIQFLKDAKFMLDNYELRKEMGENSKKLLKTTFAVDIAYKKILSSYFSKVRE